MSRNFALLASGLVLCGAALAQEAPAARPPVPSPVPLNILSCPVIARLGLSEAQLKKVTALEAEYDKKITAVGICQGDEGIAKRRETEAEFREALVELFDAGQKKRYAAGLAVLKEFRPSLDDARAALEEAGGETGDRTRAQGQLDAVLAAQDKALDEKVGPKPAEGGAAPAAGPKAGSGPAGCCPVAAPGSKAGSGPAGCCPAAAPEKKPAPAE
jgi:hypothetical protein